MSLTDEEKQTLLRIARESMEHAVHGISLPPFDSSTFTPALQKNGASFVTLTIYGGLRGCIGALEAYQPLAQDVRDHAIAAALEDPRFPPVQEKELEQIHIEVSRLTEPQALTYSNSNELIAKLRPHVDGVILKHGFRKATFLPQVWGQVPAHEDFLSQLCSKMGERPNLWREAKLQVYTYQVEEFHELN